MRDDVRRYLDGEAPLPSGPGEAEARAWQRLLVTLEAEPPGPAPPWLEGRVMAEVRALERPERESPLAWLLRPRTLRLSPLAGSLAAAVMATVMVVPWLLRPGPAGAPGPAAAAVEPADAVVYVEFVLEAPDARSVAVAGDFNRWSEEHRLQDADRDGVWTGRVAVRPGVHQYMFVVDGQRWITDPRAERYVDDGFGNRNAVLAVAPPDDRS